MAASLTKEIIGTYDDGRDVFKYTFTDEKGQRAAVMNIGCAILELCIKDKNGVLTDVMCGLPDYETYIKVKGLAGATVGRVANRTKAGRFMLDGKEIVLETNERGVNHLHGGKKAFQSRYWDGEIVDDTVVFTYVSKDGEEGYPGNLTLKMTVSFKNDTFRQETEYFSDALTVCNLTNHASFNLNGQGVGDVLNHSLVINADQFSVVDVNCIPVDTAPVAGTCYDFREPHTIGERIDDQDQHMVQAHGYDINYILNNTSPCAKITGDLSGITMAVNTYSPDLMLYTNNHMGMPFMCHGKNGATYVNYGGFCLEPHAVPNACNTDLDQVLVEPGKTYKFLFECVFSVEQ